MSIDTEATLSAKGQVTIPSRIRHAMGLKPGQKIVLSMRAANELVIKPAEVDLSDLFGMFKADHHVPIEDLSAESGHDNDLD